MTSPNVAGRACSLTVIAPIARGHEEPLRSCLAHFGPGERSPLAVLTTLHFARWVVFTFPLGGSKHAKPKAGGGVDAGRTYLLFDAWFDGPLTAFLEAMRTQIGSATNAVWQHCESYPGSSDAVAFADYIRRHQVNALLALAAYPDATVQDVQDSLSLRRRIIAFAVAAQELDASALLKAFRDAFQRDRSGAPDTART